MHHKEEEELPKEPRRLDDATDIMEDC